MARIIISGGAGFIGSHVADRLLARGDEVLIIDNLQTGSLENLETARTQQRLIFVQGTIANSDLVSSSFAAFRPDVVLHAAASYSDPDDWAEDARTNTLGTVNIVQAMQRHGTQRLVYCETAHCYGLLPKLVPIPIDHLIRPEGSSYAISKTAGEEYIRLSTLDWQVFVFSYIYGPRSVSGAIPTFFKRLRAGKQCIITDTRRDLIYVEDLVNLLVTALDGKGTRGRYHVANGKDVTIRSIYDRVWTALGSPAAIFREQTHAPEDLETILLDPTKTFAEFGWLPETSLDIGLDKTITWLNQHPPKKTYTHLRLYNDE